MVLLAIASPHGMPPAAPMPSSALLESVLQRGDKPAFTLAISGGLHDWQVPVRAALDPARWHTSSDLVRDPQGYERSRALRSIA